MPYWKNLFLSVPGVACVTETKLKVSPEGVKGYKK